MGEKLKDLSTVRQEVLVGLIIDKFIHEGDYLNVGENTNLKLPDIFNDDKIFGSEVVWVEHAIDYNRKDFMCQAMPKDGNKQVLEMDNSNSDSLVLFRTAEWIRKSYTIQLKNKLEKLNKGNYSNCKNISLSILSTQRMVGIECARILQEEYKKLLLQFDTKFDIIYLITNSKIYCITENEIDTIPIFSAPEYGECIVEMKTKLGVL